VRHLSIDIETYSSVDIRKAGLYKYAQSQDFEILLFAYSVDGGRVEVVDFTEGAAIPPVVLEGLFDEAVTKHAYNASFEWHCLSRHFQMPHPEKWITQWQDTMLHALYCGYPASLEAAGQALGLQEDKKKLTTGKNLIRTFCTPKKSTARDLRTRVLPHHEPVKWELFKEYNRQDVITEMAIENALAYYPVPAHIQKEWQTDLRINARGIYADMELVNGALYCDNVIKESLTKTACTLTELTNPNSAPQLTKWLAEQGIQTENLQKATVEDLLETAHGDVKTVLEIRQELSKTSNKKYEAISAAVGEDGRVRGLLQFYGANRTGRWAGRLVQVQNLPRTHLHGAVLDIARDFVRQKKVDALNMCIGSVPDTLSQLIRTALIAEEGKIFIDADFSAIEARVIAWLAGEQWVLDVFTTHGKIYEACASQMFGVPLEKISRGNPEYELRQKGKVATLALGYQGGTGALVQMGALKMGIPEEDLPDIVQRWRAANKRIVGLWYSVEAAALETTQTGRQTSVRSLVFSMEGDANKSFLTISLPSGRKLYYSSPKLGTNRFGGQSIQYMGMNQTTKKWESVETYGGKLTENVIQAIARDCLAINIERLEEAGYPVVMHVHDEVVIEKDLPADAHAELEKVCGLMSQPISWAPGLPLAAEGWTGDYYTKD